MIVISVIGAIIPAWYLVNYFVKSDRFPEPEEKIRTTFIGGITCVFWVLLCAIPISVILELNKENLSIVMYAALQAFFCAAIPEEFFKYRVLKKMSSDKEFDEPMDGVVYGAVASLGFAALENILYCLEGGLSTVISRALTAVPAHASFGALMGYYYSKNHFANKKNGIFGLQLMVPILLHGLYDFFLFVIEGISENSGEDELTDEQSLIVLVCVCAFFSTGYWMYNKVHSVIEEMQKGQDEMLAKQNNSKE